MNRPDFLKNLAAGTKLLTQAAPLVSANADLDAVIWYPAIPVYENFVRGFKLHAGPANLPKMELTDRLDLVLEPETRKDIQEVSIYWEGQKIGFIPEEEHRTIKAILGNGFALYAEITELYRDSAPWQALFFTVFLVTIPELLAPEALENPKLVWVAEGPDHEWLTKLDD